jgi:hypothetical protein
MPSLPPLPPFVVGGGVITAHDGLARGRTPTIVPSHASSPEHVCFLDRPLPLSAVLTFGCEVWFVFWHYFCRFEPTPLPLFLSVQTCLPRAGRGCLPFESLEWRSMPSSLFLLSQPSVGWQVRSPPNPSQSRMMGEAKRHALAAAFAPLRRGWRSHHRPRWAGAGAHTNHTVTPSPRHPLPPRSSL